MASSPSRTARSPIPCATCVSRSRITRPWAARSRSRRTSCSSRSTASPTASTSATAGCRRCGCARSRSPGRRSIERRARLMTRELIAVVDLGAQYAQLIARRVRECRVYCEVLPYATTWDDLASRNVKGVILSGGPASVYEPGAPRVDSRRTRLVYRRRSAGEDHALHVARREVVPRRRVRQDLAVHAALADTPRDELRVLGAEVDDRDELPGHEARPPLNTASSR